MMKATKKLSRTLLRRNLDRPSTNATPTRAELFLVVYLLLDRAQTCAEPVKRLKEARAHLDTLIASYSVRR